MAKDKKEKRYYNGIQIDSDEEMLTLMWLEELGEKGFIEKIERAESFELSDGLTNVYEETIQMKTKSKTVEKRKTILEAHIYTPEFVITWSPIAVVNLLYRHVNSIREKFTQLFMYNQTRVGPVSYIEVKPEWDQNNMTRLFKINQKWIWEKYGIFINLVQPAQLCAKTFTPKKWLTTATGKKRLIHWETRSIDEWLNSIGASNG